MRSLIASFVVLAFAALLAIEVGSAVQASVGKLAAAVSMSTGSVKK